MHHLPEAITRCYLGLRYRYSSLLYIRFNLLFQRSTCKMVSISFFSFKGWWLFSSRKIEAKYWIIQPQPSLETRNSDLTRSPSMPCRKVAQRSHVSEERCIARHCHEKAFSLVLSLLQASRLFNRKRSLQIESSMSHAERIRAFENI